MDLSAVASGKSECGRTNMRIVGWRGRADQTTKIKGMFVRPEQVADLVARHSEIIKARVNVSRSENNDVMDVLLDQYVHESRARQRCHFAEFHLYAYLQERGLEDWV